MGENEPIESLAIWDILQPSSHSPPSEERSFNGQMSVGPRLVKKLLCRDLDFLDIRQRGTPSFRKITLDGSACVYFFEDGSVRKHGSHVGHGDEEGRRNTRDVAWERIVAIPVIGSGPRWEDRSARESTFVGDWQYTHDKSLDLLTPKRATCWRCDGMGLGVRNQGVRDVRGSINYCVLQGTIGFPEFWVSLDSHDWCTEINLQDIQWKWNQIYGDESYLLIQNHKALHILQFNVDFRAKKHN